MMRVLEVYRLLEEGRTPSGDLVQTNNIAERVVAPSQRGDVTIAEHVEDDVYDVIRIEPEKESQQKQIQRQTRTPFQRASQSRRVESCQYKLQRTALPAFADPDTNASIRMLHDACTWRAGVEKRGRARSGDELQRAWERWRARDQ